MIALLVNAGVLAYLAWQLRLVNRYMPATLREAEKGRLALEMGVPVRHLYYHLNQVQLRRVDAWKESLFAHDRDFRDERLRETYRELGNLPAEHAYLWPADVR